MCGGRPPAAPLPNQPPNHARSRHRWRGRQPGRFLRRRRVPYARLALHKLPAALLKLVVGRSLNPSMLRPCVWSAARAAAWGPDRAAVAWGAHPRLRWAGAVGRVGRGGQDSVRLPVSPRPRAHVRWAPARRPAANPAAQPRSQQTPLARPQTWAFSRTPSRAVARLGLSNLPAALLKRVVGRPSTRSASRACAWSAASAARVGRIAPP